MVELGLALLRLLLLVDDLVVQLDLLQPDLHRAHLQLTLVCLKLSGLLVKLLVEGNLTFFFILLDLDYLCCQLGLALRQNCAVLVVELLQFLVLGSHILDVLLRLAHLIFLHLRVLPKLLTEHIVVFFHGCVGVCACLQLVLVFLLNCLELLLLGDQLALCLLETLFKLLRIKLLALL